MISVIKSEIFLDLERNPIEKVLSEVPSENSIGSFQDTFLSNFQPVPVEMDGITYPTVEHAYQRAKFDIDALATLSQERREEVLALLSERGFPRTVEQLPTIFSDPEIKPGTIKRVADLLRTYDLVGENWDDKRVDSMIDLLMQKYQHPDLARQLQATGEKVLIEGNTWDDTFWGVTDNKGRNMLGRIVMNIREKLNNGEIKTLQTA